METVAVEDRRDKEQSGAMEDNLEHYMFMYSQGPPSQGLHL